MVTPEYQVLRIRNVRYVWELLHGLLTVDSRDLVTVIIGGGAALTAECICLQWIRSLLALTTGSATRDLCDLDLTQPDSVFIAFSVKWR